MAILGIDFGIRKIGLAILSMGIIMPYKVIFNEGNEVIIEKIKEIIEDEFIKTIIIGIPLSNDGTENETSKIISNFIDYMKLNIDGTLIITQNEYGSTKAAISKCKERGYKGSKIRSVKDMESACNIIEMYMNRNGTI